jgi:lysozyme
MNLDRLKTHLRVAEGFRGRPYLDTAGVWTCGYGHAMPNLTREEVNTIEWDRDQADKVLDEDVAEAIHDAASFPWWPTLDPVHQAVVVELCFNLGRAGFAKFVKTISAIQNREYQRAGRMLLQSKWATQVGPTRSGRLARMLETGRDD